MVLLGSTQWAIWIQLALARYPSTAKSGRLWLLCETSLTHCPHLQEPLNPEPQLKSIGSSLCLERAGQIESLTKIRLTSLDQSPITFMPPLGLQAHICKLQSSAQQHKNLNSNDLIFQFTRSSLQLIFTQHYSTRTI